MAGGTGRDCGSRCIFCIHGSIDGIYRENRGW